MVRSLDGYYALCEYQEKGDAVEARLHHSLFVLLAAPLPQPRVLRKEHATEYWVNKAATGLKIDSFSRPTALECLATLGFPDVDEGWESVLLKPQKKPRFSDFYRDYMTRQHTEDEREETTKGDEAKRKEETRRLRRVQLGLPEYDSL